MNRAIAICLALGPALMLGPSDHTSQAGELPAVECDAYAWPNYPVSCLKNEYGEPPSKLVRAASATGHLHAPSIESLEAISGGNAGLDKLPEIRFDSPKNIAPPAPDNWAEVVVWRDGKPTVYSVPN